jgi:hypothetical protein
MVKSLPALPYTSVITTAHPWEVSYGALTNTSIATGVRRKG